MLHHFHMEIVPQSCKSSGQKFFSSETVYVFLRAMLNCLTSSSFKGLFNARLLSLTFTEDMKPQRFFKKAKKS